MTQSLRRFTRRPIETRDAAGTPNGILLPIYNVNDGYLPDEGGVQQVYLTTVLPGGRKGPHLHHIRRGWFTCIKGNVRIVVRIDGAYQVYLSGEDHEYASVEIPVGVPALLENKGTEIAYVLNMPSPAWTPDMNDEHSADFSDFTG